MNQRIRQKLPLGLVVHKMENILSTYGFVEGEINPLKVWTKEEVTFGRRPYPIRIFDGVGVPYTFKHHPKDVLGLLSFPEMLEENESTRTFVRQTYFTIKPGMNGVQRHNALVCGMWGEEPLGIQVEAFRLTLDILEQMGIKGKLKLTSSSALLPLLDEEEKEKVTLERGELMDFSIAMELNGKKLISSLFQQKEHYLLCLTIDVDLMRSIYREENKDTSLLLYEEGQFQEALRLARDLRRGGQKTVVMAKKEDIDLENYLLYAQHQPIDSFLYLMHNGKVVMCNLLTGEQRVIHESL